MAWALYLDGNSYIQLSAPHTLAVGEKLTYTGTFEDSGQSLQMFVDFYLGGGNFVCLRPSRVGQELQMLIGGVNAWGDISLTVGGEYVYTLERTSTQYIHTFDGVEQFRGDYTGDVILYGFSDSAYKSKGQFIGCTIDNGGLVANFDPTSSDHNGTTPQPIVVDTVGGNDANGVNFPTIGANYDPSVWIDVGGSEPVEIDISFNKVSTQSLTNSFLAANVANVVFSKAVSQSVVGAFGVSVGSVVTFGKVATVSAVDGFNVETSATVTFDKVGSDSVADPFNASMSANLIFNKAVSTSLIESFESLVGGAVIQFSPALTPTTIQPFTAALTTNISFTAALTPSDPSSFLVLGDLLPPFSLASVTLFASEQQYQVSANQDEYQLMTNSGEYSVTGKHSDYTVSSTLH